MRARGAPEDHSAEGTVRLEPGEAHPGDAVVAVVEIAWSGPPPASLAVGCSPPEDFEAGAPEVSIRPDGATVTVPLAVGEEAELGRYYAQVVYADERREHFEAEAPLELTKHWVTIESVTSRPARASPGDTVDVSVRMSFGGEGRVRGHARGLLRPEQWSGDEAQVLRLSKERSSVATEREVAWHVRVPKEAPMGHWTAEVEFSSQEGTESRKVPRVLLVVPRRAVAADSVEAAPAMLAPGEPFGLRARVENTGLDALDVRVGGELAPEGGGSAVPLEERSVPLGAGEERVVAWDIAAPDRTGRWLCRVRARAERCEGADPTPALLDVRPPHQPDAISVIPSAGWAAPGDPVELVAQLVDAGSHPGCEATVTLALEDDSGARTAGEWRGAIGAEPALARATVRLSADAVAVGGAGATARYAALVLSADGRELIRVPGAVRVRRRIELHAHVLTARPDPGRISDCLVFGERVVATVGAGALRLHELSSGCRIYSREGLVFGVDAPMDEDFWGEALDAELRAYTDMHSRLDRIGRTARAEATVVRALKEGLAGGPGIPSSATSDALALAGAFDPGGRDADGAPKDGALAAFASYLGDRGASTQAGREALAAVRSMMDSLRGSRERPDPVAEAVGAADASAKTLDRLAELLEGARDGGGLDERRMEGAMALLASAGVAQVDLHTARARAEPGADPAELQGSVDAVIATTASTLSSALALLSANRTRRLGVLANLRARASHAAVARQLRVEAAPVVAHSGDASELAVDLENASGVDLALRVNIALPSPAWAVLEPRSTGTEGLASIGPVALTAGSRARLSVLVYVPTTARLDRYVIPVEVVPEHFDLVQERGGESA